MKWKTKDICELQTCCRFSWLCMYLQYIYPVQVNVWNGSDLTIPIYNKYIFVKVETKGLWDMIFLSLKKIILRCKKP